MLFASLLFLGLAVYLITLCVRIVANKTVAGVFAAIGGAFSGMLGLALLAGALFANSVDTMATNPPATTPRLSPSAARPEPQSEPKRANLELTTTQTDYSYGYLSLVGTVKNTGNAPIFSPSIKIRVYGDEEGKLLLAEDTAFIAGAFLANMEPGAEAAWEAFVRIPGEPDHIWWEMFVD